MSLLLSIDDDPRTISLRLRLLNLANLMAYTPFADLDFVQINTELQAIERAWLNLERTVV